MSGAGFVPLPRWLGWAGFVLPYRLVDWLYDRHKRRLMKARKAAASGNFNRPQ